MVTAMDASIGQVVQAYKDAGLWDNTVVIFSSDNGGKVKTGASNQPLRAQKEFRLRPIRIEYDVIQSRDLNKRGHISKVE